MALTATQTVSIRRHAGYPLGSAAPADDAVTAALAALAPEEEVVLTATFLAHLDRLEAAVLASGAAADTAKAAVWERNENELAERVALYRHHRLALCRFLGVQPGLAIGDMPAFSTCCPPRTTTGSGVVVDPITGLAPIPVVYVV